MNQCDMLAAQKAELLRLNAEIEARLPNERAEATAAGATVTAAQATVTAAQNQLNEKIAIKTGKDAIVIHDVDQLRMNTQMIESISMQMAALMCPN